MGGRGRNEWVDGVEGPNIAIDMTNAPTKANLIADLAALGSQVGSNDLFVFYFSGHGMQVTGTPPVEYIVPEGGVSGGYGIPANSVSDTELGSFLGPISTKRKVVILDTCNSGGFIGNTLEADSIPTASGGSAGGISPQTLAQALSNYLNFLPPPTDSRHMAGQWSCPRRGGTNRAMRHQAPTTTAS